MNRVRRCIVIAMVVLAGCSSSTRAADWTVGNKSLLYIRIDFADLAGPPVSDQEIRRILTAVDVYCRDSSFDRFQLHSTPTPTLRMPHPVTFYAGNPDDQA